MTVFHVTAHAVDRYIERIRQLEPAQARKELERLLGLAELTTEPPAWFRGDLRCPDGFAVVGGDIVIPLRATPSGAWIAMTCVTRGAISDETRASKRASRADYRDRQRARRFHQKARDRRSRTGLDPEPWEA